MSELELLAVVLVASFEDLFGGERQFKEMTGLKKFRSTQIRRFNWPFNFYALLL